MSHLPISKKQMALAYAPDLTVGGAVNRLRKWLHLNPELIADLRRTGYRETQHILTTRQVEIIYHYLGEP